MLISSKHYRLEGLFKGTTTLDDGVIVLSSSGYLGFHINHKLPLNCLVARLEIQMNNTCQNYRFLPNSKTFFTL